MSEFSRLKNEKVIAHIDNDEGNFEIEGTVLDVTVNDFYFYDKGEPIYVTVSVNPTSELPNEVDMEELHEVPLSQIRKA